MTSEQRAAALARVTNDLDALIADREARVRLMVQTGYDECCAIATSDGYLRLARCLTAYVRDAEAGQEPMDSGVGAIFPGGDEVKIDSLMHARDAAEVDATAQEWLEGSPP